MKNKKISNKYLDSFFIMIRSKKGKNLYLIQKIQQVKHMLSTMGSLTKLKELFQTVVTWDINML